jgi:antitoxin VapB
MNRTDEINLKHDRLKHYLAANHLDSLLLRRTRNIAWFTAGADASIPVDSEVGMYGILVTPTARTIIADNIESERIHAEERFEDFGFDYQTPNWWEMRMPDVMSDLDDAVEGDIQQMRWALTEGEQDRLRSLGRDTAAALEEAAGAIQPGMTEFEIASNLAAACLKRGGWALVNLIGTDERISQFRHPMATDKKLDKLALMVVCMRRHGLIVSGSRFVHVGAAPAELREKIQKAAAIDAAVMIATRPGRTLGDAFADLQAAYAAQGEADQWKFHHQGGSAGYVARERVATPGDSTLIEDHQMFAWNPSIVGAKSEDTILITGDTFEIVSAASPSFPTVMVDVNGQSVARPGVLEI